MKDHHEKKDHLDFFITWSSDHVTSEKRYISTPTRPMAIKVDREAASDEEISSIKSHKLLILCKRQVT